MNKKGTYVAEDSTSLVLGLRPRIGREGVLPVCNGLVKEKRFGTELQY